MLLTPDYEQLPFKDHCGSWALGPLSFVGYRSQLGHI